MLRLYLALILACVWLPPAAEAQTKTALVPPPLGSTLTIDALTDLPSGGNLFTLLDTVIPEVITDRVDTGGLSTGRASRLGARGSTWTQTVFRLDGVDISASDGTGTPLLLPGVLAWDHVHVSTGVMPVDINAPGLAISLAPRRPTKDWTRVVEGIGSGPAFNAGTGTTQPAIARLNSGAYGSALFSGPLTNRVGIVLAGTWNASTRFERGETTRLDATHGSLFTHLVFNASPRDEVRVVGWTQRSSSPFENRIAFGQPTSSEREAAVHAQLVWDRRTAAGEQDLWSGFASYSVSQRTLDVARSSAIVIERITDGPVEALLYPGPATERSWSIGARLNPSNAGQGGRPMAQLGAELSGNSVRMRPAVSGRIGELVSGLPARVWDYTDPGVPSRWSNVSLAVYASDRIQVHPRVVIEGGVRFEHVSGSAEAGTDHISWNNVLPRAGFRWELIKTGHLAALAGYSRTAHRLVLTDLAWGDPQAPTGSVYRWNSSSPAVHAPAAAERGALVARAGPGAGSTSGFSSIDPNLERPQMDEFTFGVESRPNPSTVFRLTGMGRRERGVIGVVATGVPESAYSVIRLSDPGLFGTGQVLTIYNRPVSTFGADRYTLTNPVGHEMTYVGAELTGQTQLSRLFLLFGLTAGRAEGLAAFRGFRAIENDPALLGETFINPNARTFAQGRPFTDRGYTIKLSSVYHFPHDVRLGFASRYQDGQHFSRLVVVPNLNQGPEIVRAFRNGRTRFTFTGTLDVRLQKGFTAGRRHVAVVLEGYNVLNMALEIEEFQVSGASSRATTAVQPPRAIHAGIRLTF